MPKLSIDIEARFAQAMDALDALGRKADTQARLITTAFRGVGGVLTAAFGAVSFAAIERVADSIAAYQDLADQIGDTASAVSSLQKAADLSGASLQEVAQASARMTSTFAKGGTEATRSAEALKAINIEVEEFKRLSPVEQIDRIAKQLAKFEDGAGKTAVAMQLFGRSGAQLIPFFNDLAEAGRENERLTEEQIKAADGLTKELARMRSEFGALSQRIGADVIPAFNSVLTKINEIRGTSLAGWLTVSGAQEDDAAAEVARIGKELEKLEKLRSELDPGKNFTNKLNDIVFGDVGDLDKQIALLKKQQTYLAAVAKTQEEARRAAAIDALGLSGWTPDRERLQYGGDKDKDKDDGRTTKRETEAQKILEFLERQQEKLAELNIYEQTALDLVKARNKEYSGLTPEIEKQILARAREVQAQADATKADKARQDQEREGFERFLTNIQAVEKLADSYRDLGDPTRRYIQQLEEIDKLLKQNKLTSEEATRARDAINDRMASLNQKIDKPFGEMSVYADQAARNVQTAFADYLFDPFDKGVEGMLENFSTALRRMAAEVAAAKIIDYIKQWALTFGPGTSVNSTGTTLRAEEGGTDAIYNGAEPKSAVAPQVTVNVNGQGPQLTQAEFQRVVRDAVRNGMRETALRNG